MSLGASETLSLLCGGCGNLGTALREAGDRLPYSTSSTFFLRYSGIRGASIQIVCGTCGRVQPLNEAAARAIAAQG